MGCKKQNNEKDKNSQRKEESLRQKHRQQESFAVDKALTINTICHLVITINPDHEPLSANLVLSSSCAQQEFVESQVCAGI